MTSEGLFIMIMFRQEAIRSLMSMSDGESWCNKSLMKVWSWRIACGSIRIPWKEEMHIVGTLDEKPFT